jgi:hypothetical protein
MALGASRSLRDHQARSSGSSARTGLLTAGLLGFARISGRDRAPALHQPSNNQFYSLNDPSQADGQPAHR